MLGEFRIEAVLGQGGSGIVYDATWGPRRVALKVLHPSLVGTGKERSQFLTEAQRLQQIAHPSVVKVLAVGQLPDGRPYLAMERLEGETLASLVSRGALPLTRSLEMFGELCSAVAALHEQGLVHRDLKPENVFVVAQKHAVLLDFGIAKDLAAPASTTTQEGNVRGTPAYMAPERFFGQPAGIPTDVYELAVVLYVMLAGRLPWDTVSDPETRLSPRSLIELAPDVPEALDVEIRRALSTRVQNRPASATALLEAVTAAAATASEEPSSAASTARLRSGAHETVQPQATTGSKPSKPPTVREPARTMSAEHQTPLAWAPTEAAPKSDAPPSSLRTNWPIAVALGAVAIAGGLVAWWRLREKPSTTTAKVAMRDAGAAQFSDNDPWGENGMIASTTPTPTPEKKDSDGVQQQTKAFALIGDKLTPAQYRAEAVAAIAKLPTDTRLLIGVQLVDLRANSQTAQILDSFAKHPKVSALTLVLPACVRAIAGDAEWFVFGAPGLEASENGTLIIRGRWRRADVEACFADTVRTHVALDGAKLFRIGDNGWLDFLDDHTAYVSMNTKLEAEALHKLTKKPGGPVPRTKQLLATFPPARSLMFVADGKANDDWSMLSLPKGSDVLGWLLVEDSGVSLDFSADPKTPAAAQAALDKVKPQIDEVFGAADPAAVGKLTASLDGTTVHVKGHMTSLMLGIVTAALQQ